MTEIKFPVGSKVKFTAELTRGRLEVRGVTWTVIDIISPGYEYWVNSVEHPMERHVNTSHDYLYHCTFYSKKRGHAIHRFVYDNELVLEAPADMYKTE